MDKVTNILIVGVGGQGTLLASNILSSACVKAGFDAKKSEIHGMSQRGGSVFSHVRFGKKVYSPVIPEGEVDVIVSLEEMEAARWVSYLKPESKIIILANRILPANVTEYPEGVTEELASVFPGTYVINPKEYAEKLGNEKFLNVFLLGVLSNLIDINEDAWKDAINELVPEGTFEKNYAAFQEGMKIK